MTVTYGDGKFVAVTYFGTNRVMYSTRWHRLDLEQQEQLQPITGVQLLMVTVSL